LTAKQSGLTSDMTVKATGFGWIETDCGRFESDVLVYPEGKIENRYDYPAVDSHLISQEEVQRVLQDTVAVLVIGTGQSGLAALAEPAQKFLKQRGIKFRVLPTPEAIVYYNRLAEPKAAIFHLTC